MSRSPAARRLATYARLTALGLLTGLALAAFPTAPVTAAAPQADPSISELQQALDQLVEDGAPGALLYTYDHGRVTELQSGVADIAAGTPMSAQDHYRIGSLTKTYVSTAVLDLVAEHRIRLKDPVKRYLPGFLNGGPRVTIRQLLNHTSGSVRVQRRPARPGALPEGRPRARLDAPAARAHRADPRLGVGARRRVPLLQHQLPAGRAAGADRDRAPAWPTCSSHRVFAPAHLEATTFTTSTTLPAPAAHGYFAFSGGEPTDITGLYPYPWASGATVSTAPDVARFYRSLLSGDLLPSRLMSAMETTVDASAEEGAGTSYGLGLERFSTPVVPRGVTGATSPVTSPTSTPPRAAVVRRCCSSTRTLPPCPRRSGPTSTGC